MISLVRFLQEEARVLTSATGSLSLQSLAQAGESALYCAVCILQRRTVSCLARPSGLKTPGTYDRRQAGQQDDEEEVEGFEHGHCCK
jgi:hypothetical protein